jgi:hypothetical protein
VNIDHFLIAQAAQLQSGFKLVLDLHCQTFLPEVAVTARAPAAVAATFICDSRENRAQSRSIKNDAITPETPFETPGNRSNTNMQQKIMERRSS